MSINTDLINALYAKYAPEKNVEAQTRYINNNYTSQDKFVEDFYKEYGVELGLKQKVFINANFGGFEETVNPTVKVEDYDVSMSETSAEFVSIGSLTDQEYEDIDIKFADISYFDETFVDEYEELQNIGGSQGAMVDVIMGGKISNAAEELATKPVYTQDFPGLTKKDFEYFTIELVILIIY